MDLREIHPRDVDEFDALVHLASDVGGFLHNAAARGQAEYEVELLRAVTQLCRAKGCRRLVYTSSIAVFEQAKRFEDGPLKNTTQRTQYARGKALGEKWVETHFSQFAIVRPTNIFGASAQCRSDAAGESHVIPDLLRKIHTQPTLEVLGDGTQVRNFVHVDDVVGFLLTVLRQPQRGWYNLRSNIQLSIGELAQQLLELTGVRREIVFSPEYQHYEPRPIEAFDMTEALELGWRPLVSSLRDGLRLDGARLALGGE